VGKERRRRKGGEGGADEGRASRRRWIENDDEKPIDRSVIEVATARYVGKCTAAAEIIR